MAPRARLLVYYMRDDGEVVADSLHFAVSGAIQNEVSGATAWPHSAVCIAVPVALGMLWYSWVSVT